jgi:hypothetical protein
MAQDLERPIPQLWCKTIPSCLSQTIENIGDCHVDDVVMYRTEPKRPIRLPGRFREPGSEAIHIDLY